MKAWSTELVRLCSSFMWINNCREFAKGYRWTHATADPEKRQAATRAGAEPGICRLWKGTNGTFRHEAGVIATTHPERRGKRPYDQGCRFDEDRCVHGQPSTRRKD